jgi:hypothetical protein
MSEAIGRALRGESAMTIPVELLGFLAVLLDALDIPALATVGESEQYGRVLADRAMHAVIALPDVLDGNTLGIESTTEYLSKRLAEHPPTGYRAVAKS